MCHCSKGLQMNLLVNPPHTLTSQHHLLPGEKFPRDLDDQRVSRSSKNKSDHEIRMSSFLKALTSFLNFFNYVLLHRKKNKVVPDVLVTSLAEGQSCKISFVHLIVEFFLLLSHMGRLLLLLFSNLMPLYKAIVAVQCPTPFKGDQLAHKI